MAPKSWKEGGGSPIAFLNDLFDVAITPAFNTVMGTIVASYG